MRTALGPAVDTTSALAPSSRMRRRDWTSAHEWGSASGSRRTLIFCKGAQVRYSASSLPPPSSLARHTGHLRVAVLTSCCAQPLQRHMWRHGRTVVSRGSDRQMTQSEPPIAASAAPSPEGPPCSECDGLAPPSANRRAGSRRGHPVQASPPLPRDPTNPSGPPMLMVSPPHTHPCRRSP